MTYRLRRIPAVRAANLLTLSLALPSGLISLVAACVSLPTGVASRIGQDVAVARTGAAEMFSAALGSWLVNMILFWVSVAIACALYNLIAGRMGGIDLELETAPPA
jgi:hypothetical protein